jgi:hypothetical protein
MLAVVAVSSIVLETASAAEVSVRWTFAATNMDGTPVTDLAGAKVYYGTTSSNYTHVLVMPGGEPGHERCYTVTGLVEGVQYYLNGTAYNTAGLESDFCREVAKVASVNQAPQVDAGPDAKIVFSALLPLRGTVTDDGQPTGSTITSVWSKVSGPGSVILGEAGAIETTASFGLLGTYVLQLTASDGDRSGSNQTTVVVESRVGVPLNLRPRRVP